MKNQNKLKYIKSGEIDDKKWDRCINEASNSRVYAAIWHLDRTAVVWDALIWGDYEYVMPLPVRKKIGIHYLYQPLFTQQLGIFPPPPESIQTRFYQAVTKKFLYANILMNARNQGTPPLSNSVFLPRPNYLLPLNNRHSEISGVYSQNTRRNLKQAQNNELTFVWGISLEDYLRFKSQNMQVRLGKKDINKLKSIIAYSQYKGFGTIAGVYNADNKLCAGAFFCRWKDRIIHMNAATSPPGKTLRSMFFLIDKVIEAHAGNPVILDFEGSIIPGVARFYSGFGAIPETYFQFIHNRLPQPLKWIKRK